MTLSMNAQRELCVVQKAGGVPMAVDELLRLVGMSLAIFLSRVLFTCSLPEVGVQKVKLLDALVEDALREDWKERHIEVR